MSLATGTRLGPFEVLGKLGEGGMGEVYRARDTRLDRDVAIKVLAAPFAADSDRLARFDREAKTLAALNHPHIAQIHGLVERSPGGGDALVMELVEGEDLAERLARGPLGPGDALPIALQIADALAAAHEQGIIHRDLKPANVKVRGDGTVKVLDFGLAKLAAGEPAGDSMHSPTITSPAFAEASAGQARTALGMILGTAAYMAPEQAKGQPVDRRADVWAFGAVLYEMLTGRRAFAGVDIADTMAAILTRDPDWGALPASTPPPVRRLLRRCLEKDRKRRLADMSDARLEIEEALSPSRGADAVAADGVRPAWTWRTAVLLAAVALAFGLAGALVSRALAPAPAPPPVTRFFVPLPDGQHFVGEAGGVALSPDGSEVVYATLTGLYRRRAAELDVRRVEGIDEVPGVALEPVYSPDGRWLAFWSARDQSIKKVPAAGGAPVTIAAVAGFSGMSWGDDGILVARQSGAIERVSPDGGAPEVVVQAPPDGTPASPEMLPRGAGVMYTLGDLAGADGDLQVVVQRPGSDARKTILANASQARYLDSGHLVYAVAGTLFVVPFDLDRLEAAGTPVRVADGVRRGFPRRAINYAVSRSGSLAYVPAGSAGDAAFELALVDRTGGAERLPLPPANYVIPRVSPDGRFVAFGIADARDSVLWVYELSGASAARRLTFGDRSRYPTWSHDGSRVIFQSTREGDAALFWQRADGAGVAERLTRPGDGQMHFADAMSPDGRHLLVQAGEALHVLSLEDRSLTPFGAVRSAWSIGAAFSPDGRWVAYAVKPDLRTSAAVYVQPFPATGAVYQVPADGEAYHPMWSRDGTELFYVVAPNRLFVTRVRTEGGFSFQPPEPVEIASRIGPSSLPRFHDILPDGRLIAVVPAVPGGPAGPGGIHVVQNWTSELPRD
jgi:eukaryotic-like serine/threonine-protein kinase